MSVKLEVGAWYFIYMSQNMYMQYNGLNSRQQHCFDSGEFHVRVVVEEIDGFIQHQTNEKVYHIEPGDVVKPKPAGDKCWEELGSEWVEVSKRQHPEYEVIGFWPSGQVKTKEEHNYHLSCLILVRKAEKAQPQPETYFQVGDEVEYASHCSLAGQRRMVVGFGERGFILLGRMNGGGDCGMAEKYHLKLIRRAGEIKAENTTRVWIRPGHGHAFPTPNGTKTYENHSDKAVEVEFCHNTGLFKQVNKAAGVGPTEPMSGVLNKGTISASPAAPKPNPATLPSLSGSELVWPDVKPGALLDTLPMDDHTREDKDADAWSYNNVIEVSSIIGNIETVIGGLKRTNNADRERIRKIIPEIRKRLATLEGRL